MGLSEEILGRAINDFGCRENVVIATKLYYPMRDDINAKGLSRKTIFTEVENSLKRLGTDYIDLYIIHRFDYTTPIEEVMEALNDLVRMGKVRYIGASSMYAWQFVKANAIAKMNGWAQFISMQNIYNPLYREEEKEMIPMCIDQKIALTPYSPICHGAILKNPNDDRTDGIGKLQEPYVLEKDKEIIRRIQELAKNKGISPSALTFAWIKTKPYITSPIVGGSKISYIEEAIKGMNVNLTKEEVAYIEEVYIPHKQYGFR